MPRRMSEARVNALIPPRPQPRVIVLTEDEWEAQYDQLVADGIGIWDDVGEAIDIHRQWTLVETDNDGLAILNGRHVVNKIGYIVTTKAWQEGDDITVNVDKVDDSVLSDPAS